MLLRLLKTRHQGMTDKPVFMHYMVGGITEGHCKQDMQDAKALGIDAFALNFNQFADWSQRTVDHLFNNADTYDFKLFFSFDMSPGYFTNPSQYAHYCTQHMSRNAYFKIGGKPLITTFGSGGVSNGVWKNFKLSLGVEIILIVGLYNNSASSSFFDKYPSLDGVFNWDSWPKVEEGRKVVSIDEDKVYQRAARTSSKLFMMGLSPLQFKHINSTDNWYRLGEGNLENRFGQVLDLQPDLLEIQSWNDAGESHYMGNSWIEPIWHAKEIHTYTEQYDHTGYWQILPAFVQAWKRGDRTTKNMIPTTPGMVAQGVFWHHTLLLSGSCGLDKFGLQKPRGIENARDSVTGIILVAKDQRSVTAVVTSGAKQLGIKNLQPGYNKFSFDGMTTGTVSVKVLKGDTTIVGGFGPIQVADSADIWNYNYQVVGLQPCEVGVDASV